MTSVIRTALLTCTALAWMALPAHAASTCEPDGVQASGSIYRICMPPEAEYNGMLVIWAHGFQDAGTPVEIPQDQLCLSGICIPDVVNALGFGFATNSYSKTGLAILEGKDDVHDLVDIFTAQKGAPTKVYLVGASEGGIITALSVEQSPNIFAAGVAACGPVGSFPAQINYFGDARATFEYFFPGLIPGPVFQPSPVLASIWLDYYQAIVKPVVMNPANRSKLDQWAKVAKLPFVESDYLNTVEQSVHDVLRYSVVNINDATATIGGFPFDNHNRWYQGSANDLLLNLVVPRATANPAALATMTSLYDTTGVLSRPLITMHTTKDQQVPYGHETLYALKTLASGSFLTRHLNIRVDRFEHCNFTADELIGSFAIMLFYDSVLDGVSGGTSTFSEDQLKSFELRMKAARIPYARAGGKLTFKLR